MARARKNRRRRLQMRNGAQAIAHPPAFNATISYAKKFRFQTSAALVNVSISMTDILGLLAVADTTILASWLNSTFRFKSIELWGPMSSTLAPVTVSVEFPNTSTLGLSGSRRIASDTSMGATQVAHVKALPLPNSLQSFWQGTAGSQPFMILNAPTNTIIDLSLDLVLQNGETPVTVAVVAATVGQVYCRALDLSTGSLCVPVSYVTI